MLNSRKNFFNIFLLENFGFNGERVTAGQYFCQGKIKVGAIEYCSLPDSVVSSNTIDTFKIRLDRFWFDQEIKYNWKADIHTGRRSQVDVMLN